MFKNLKQALNEKKISLKAYGAVIGVAEKTAYNKVNEETEITLREAMTTKTELFPEYDFWWLFESDGSGDLTGKEGA